MTDLSYKNKNFIKSLLIKEPDIHFQTIYKLVKSLNTKEISNENIKQYVTKMRFLQKGGSNVIGVCRMVNSDGTSCFINSAIHFLFKIDTFITLLDSLNENTINSLKIIDTKEIDNNIKIKEDKRDIIVNKVQTYMIANKLVIQNTILNQDFNFNKIMTDKEYIDYQTLNDEIDSLKNKKRQTCNEIDFENAKILLIIFKNILTKYREKIINNSNNKTILDLKNLNYKGTPYNVKLREIIFPNQPIGAQHDADEFLTGVNGKILCLSDNVQIKKYLDSIKMTDINSTICENGTKIVTRNYSYSIKVIPPDGEPISMQQLFDKEQEEDKREGTFDKCGNISIEDKKKKYIYNNLIDIQFMKEKQEDRYKNWQNIDNAIEKIQKIGKIKSKKRNIILDENNKYIIITVQYMNADGIAKINKNITNFNLEINNVQFIPKAFLLKDGLQYAGHYKALLKVNDKYILANDNSKLLTYDNLIKYTELNSEVTCILYEKTLVRIKTPKVKQNTAIIGLGSATVLPAPVSGSPASPPAELLSPVPASTSDFSKKKIDTFINGLNMLNNSVINITTKIDNLKQKLSTLKNTMTGGSIQTGGADIIKDITIYKEILNIVNQEALLNNFISDIYILLTNLWDPEKDTELKEYLKDPDNKNDDLQQYFIKDNDIYYFSDVTFTQIMLGQLNSNFYPNTITDKNFTRYYNIY